MGQQSRRKRQRRRGDIEQISTDVAATTEEIRRLNSRLVRLVKSINAMPNHRDIEGVTKERFEELYAQGTIGLLMSTAQLMSMIASADTRKMLRELVETGEEYEPTTYTACLALVILKIATQEAKRSAAKRAAEAKSEGQTEKPDTEGSPSDGARDWYAERDPEVLAEAALANAQALMARATKEDGISDVVLTLRTGRSSKDTAEMYSSSCDLTVRALARELAICGRRLKLESEKLAKKET